MVYTLIAFLLEEDNVIGWPLTDIIRNVQPVTRDKLVVEVYERGSQTPPGMKIKGAFP